MTTSTQPLVLTEVELAALRALAADGHADVEELLRAELVAKGMLQDVRPGTLSPAGQHAIHIGEAGTLPGLDN